MGITETKQNKNRSTNFFSSLLFSSSHSAVFTFSHSYTFRHYYYVTFSLWINRLFSLYLSLWNEGVRIRFLIVAVAVAEVVVVEEQQWSHLNLLTCHHQKDRGSTLLHLLLIHLHKVYLSLPIWSVFSLCNVHRSTFSFSTLILHNARYFLYFIFFLFIIWVETLSCYADAIFCFFVWILFITLILLYMYFY